MKTIIILCIALFATAAIARNIDWYVDDQVYQTTSCASGNSVTPPTPPTKYGYHFVEWGWYTPLEYIRSTGTQYIDTGISPADLGNSNPWLEAEFSMEQTGDNDWFGTRNRTYGTIIWDLTISSNKEELSIMYPRWGTVNSIADLAVYESGHSLRDFDFYGHIHKLRLEGINPMKAYVDDVLIATFFYEHMSMAETSHIQLCTGRSNSLSMKWRRFSAGNRNGVLINAVSYKRNSDNEIGMLDTISGTFLTNAGTGDFIAGPVVGSE